MANQIVQTQPYLLSQDGRQVVAFGRGQGWYFNYLGKAPIPEKPLHLGKWLVLPAEQDNSVMPDHAWERIQAIYQAGYQPAGWVVVHEAPKLLPAPQETEKKKDKNILGWGAALGGLVTLGAFLLPVLSAAILDPILILVTPEMEWIEIDRWFEEVK